MRIFSSKAFTLLELMIVIAILGILAAALFPAFSNYVQRGRDTSRMADIDSLSKSMNLYYSEHEDFPLDLPTGCVNYVALVNYGGSSIVDPQANHDNGCSTLAHYGYGMSTGILSDPDVYSLIAIMEQANGGNYSGSLNGFTGVLTQTAYLSGMNSSLIVKGAGQYYVRLP